MKNFILFFVALFTSVTISAQTLEPSKTFDNTYIGFGIGPSFMIQPTHNGYTDFFDSSSPIFALRLGKFLTPQFGIELEAETGTRGEHTAFSHTNIGVNFLLNANNCVHKYRGTCDLVEVIPFVGLGWYHTYRYVSNNMSVKGGINFAYNIDKKKAWQINFIPSIMYITTSDERKFSFDSRRAFLNFQVGATYKFKTSNGTHNFAISKLTHTDAEFDALNDEINKQRATIEANNNALEEKEAIIVLKSKEIEELNKKLSERTVEHKCSINPIIGFEIGNCELNETQKANLLVISEELKTNNTKIVIVGYADAETGTSERNMELSMCRAKAVKHALVELGVNSDNVTVMAKGSDEQLFEENNANRAVIFIVE